jgi:hypothetical protein
MGQILQPGDYTVLEPVIPPPVQITKTIFAGLQLGYFETLWGVGRSNPVTNPAIHGKIVQVPGNLASFDFAPAVLPNGESDNIYCLRRLINQVDLTLLTKATKFANSSFVQLDSLSSCQAFEFDLPTPLTTGTMGLQLLPGKTSWSFRAYNFNPNNKGWKPLPGTEFDPSLLTHTGGSQFGGEYYCDGKVTIVTAVIIDGERMSVNYEQPSGALRAKPLFNAAFQLDATKDAKAYKAFLNNFQVSFQ